MRVVSRRQEIDVTWQYSQHYEQNCDYFLVR